MNRIRTIIAVGLVAAAASLGLGAMPADARPVPDASAAPAIRICPPKCIQATVTAEPAPAPTQTIAAICDTGTVTIRNYPANSKVIVRTRSKYGNYEPWNTRTVYPFQGDLTVVVKVPGTYSRYAYPWIISVEFWPGNVSGFTWGQPFSRC